MPEARSWRNTALYIAGGRQEMAAVFTPRDRGRSLAIEELTKVGSSVIRETSKAACPSPSL